MANIVVVGSFDTKKEPLLLLAAGITATGSRALTIDTSVFPSSGTFDYPAEAVAREGGSDHSELRGLGRAVAVHVMAEGVAAILRKLCSDGAVDAVVCMGGSNAATVFARIAGEVPTGIPKILMSTVTAGDTRRIINASDAILLYPVVDIEGSNSILDAMIGRLVAVSVAAANSRVQDLQLHAGRGVGITMFGVTTPCVSQARGLLEAAGLEVFAFHANGSGGESLERFISEGLVSSVLDVTTTELADELFGGLFSAGPSRMTTAARKGIPQVISIGAIDMINFGPLHTVPEELRHRNLVPHNDLVTLVRTTPAENRLIGQTMADRLGPCSAPTVIVVPMKGVSQLDMDGGPFFDPAATRGFLEGLKSRIHPSVQIVELDLHINDPEFAQALVAQVLKTRTPAESLPAGARSGYPNPQRTE